MPVSELRLGYNDLTAGQPVIVIRGLPTADHHEHTGRLARAGR